MIDVERFLTDCCDVLGTPAAGVAVTHAPSPIEPAFLVDQLTGRPPMETQITVQIGDDAMTGEGIDLAEAITEVMAAISLRRSPRQPAPSLRRTVSGSEVREDEFLAACRPSRWRAGAGVGR